MSAQGEHSPGLADTVREVADRVSALLRLELELAVVEVRGQARRFVAGTVMLAMAGGVSFLGFCLGLVDIVLAATASATWWVTFLGISSGLFLLSLILLALGLRALKRGKPIPEQALAELRQTQEALRGRP